MREEEEEEERGTPREPEKFSWGSVVASERGREGGMTARLCGCAVKRKGFFCL